jgi:hypothetical protein
VTFKEMKIWAVAGYAFLTVANLNLMLAQRSGLDLILAVVWGAIAIRLGLQQASSN